MASSGRVGVRQFWISVLLCWPLAVAAASLAEGFSRLPGGATVVLMPLDIELFSVISAGGILEPQAEWTEKAHANLREAFLTRRNALKVSFRPLPDGADEVIESLSRLHRAVGQAITLHQSGLMARASTLLAASSGALPARLERPDPGSDEGGLWAMLSREEARLKKSRFLVRDEELNRYVAGVACRLAGEHCPDARVYVVRSPYFNASMAPNGMMQVWTGLLLRMDNEAQLAAVLGHEIGHYVARHGVEQLRDAKSRTALGQFLGMALGAAGVGAAGSLAQLALVAGMFAYSRDHEREADRIGQDLMSAGGYPPIEAAKVWEQLVAELKAETEWSGDAGSRSIFFASHPDPEERSQTMARRAAEMNGKQGDAGATAFAQQLRAHRRQWLEDELKRHRSGETVAVFTRLTRNSDDSEMHFFLGEAYRQRAAEGDQRRALSEYSEAESRPKCPPEVFRSRGMLQRQAGDEPAARSWFERYLSLRPDAEDVEMIRDYLREGS